MKALVCLTAFLLNMGALAATPRMAVWSEFLDYGQLYGELPRLAESKFDLFLAVPKAKWDNPFERILLLRLLVEAKVKGVDVRLWPLLEEADGYWPNLNNIDRFDPFVRDLVLSLTSVGLKPSWIVFDLEPSPETTRGLVADMKKLRFGRAVRHLNESCAPADGDSWDQFKKLSSFLKTLDVRTHAVTTPFVLEDKRRGDLHVQRALGIPLDCCSWDEVSFMAYRSELENVAGRMNSRAIYDYALQAKKAFGERAAIDLGVVGEIDFPNVVHGYASPDRLHEDIAAVLAAGVDKIHVYALDGMLRQSTALGIDRLDSWTANVDPRKPHRSVKYAVLKKVVRAISRNVCKN